MIKCICFNRKSSKRQDLTAQVAAVKAAALKEYKEEEIVEIKGQESAIKLKEEERHTLIEMKAIVEEHPSVECIYFFAVDRLARRVSVVLSIKEWADEHKINLVFLNPFPFSTWFKNTEGEWKKNDISDIYLMFLSTGAKMEMQIKGERFANAKRWLKDNNKVTGNLPYGYCSGENKDITINKDEAKVIRWIFDSYLNQGLSCSKIYESAIELGYFENKIVNRANQAGKIQQILKNKNYCGKATPTGIVYPLIIDEDIVDNAIAVMKKRQCQPKNNLKHVFYCKGILKDEHSNTVMITDFNHVKYTATNNPYNHFGVNMNIADYLCWTTAFECKWEIMSFQNNAEEQIKLSNEQITEVSTKIINIKKELENEVLPRYEKAYNAFIISRGRITEEMYDKNIKEIDSEQNKLKKKIEALEKREVELSSLILELKKKEKLDINIYTVKEITDDNERVEIINECITGMTVKKKKNYYIFKVHSLMPMPNKYYYISHGCKKGVYWAIDNCYEPDEFKPDEALDKGEVIDITSEVEKRFKRT